ncbi:MAG: ribosome maturation factor RimM [Pseudomonadales bacterium]|nr:ribosome maturation factor RimM [Pseudomonadales bacterium]MCC6529004.1 ribosome maturation factor RimM [Pseudomonadales bacterium]MCP5331905.1 ribosome maturation factor RimM [Pseudomonadales bacterium]HMU90918.1 ribosome maturation factor RimM [Pseudomonadales bacterium]HMW15375.1 ribosome maturation factor RimM [Pseudomonadales bacterium]
MKADEWVVLGKVSTAFGIKGWVKIHSYTEPPENLLHYPQLWRVTAQGRQKIDLVEAKVQGRGLIGRFADCDDRDQALGYAGDELAVPATALPELEAGDYYWHQLEGMRVINRQGELLGWVDRLFETGANDVVVVRPGEGSIDERERLIPYLPERVVIRVDLEQAELHVDWPADF